MTVSLIGNLLGFAGGFIILAVYARQTLFSAPTDALYYLGNLLGTALLGASLTIHFNLASLCLQVALGRNRPVRADQDPAACRMSFAMRASSGSA